MSIKEAYQEKLNHQMEEWKDEMKVLKDKIGKMSAEAKIKANEELEALQKKQTTASEKLKALKDTGEDVWEQAKAGLELAWEEIKIGMEAIKKHF